MLLLVIALVAAACGSAADDVSAPAQSAAEQDVPATASDTTAGGEVTEPIEEPSEAPPATTSTDVPAETVAPQPAFDGPPAPDFSMTLADGTEFVLSAETRPVYLVFWAEW